MNAYLFRWYQVYASGTKNRTIMNESQDMNAAAGIVNIHAHNDIGRNPPAHGFEAIDGAHARNGSGDGVVDTGSLKCSVAIRMAAAAPVSAQKPIDFLSANVTKVNHVIGAWSTQATVRPRSAADRGLISTSRRFVQVDLPLSTIRPQRRIADILKVDGEVDELPMPCLEPRRTGMR